MRNLYSMRFVNDCKDLHFIHFMHCPGFMQKFDCVHNRDYSNYLQTNENTNNAKNDKNMNNGENINNIQNGKI